MKRLGLFLFIFVLLFGFSYLDSNTANAATSTYNLGSADTDGDGAMESVVLREEIDYGTPKLELFVVIDNYQYKIFSNTFGSEYCIFYYGLAETNGRAGKEVVVGVSYKDGTYYNHYFLVVSDRQKMYREYNAGHWYLGSYTSHWSMVGIQNMDGAAGDEIVYRDDDNVLFAIKDSNQTIYRL